MKTSQLILLVVALVLTSFIHSTQAEIVKGYCPTKCAVRCEKAPLKELCLKYCGICCAECKCVAGASKHECPCYKEKKTSKGKPMCP